jgi:hypothetical protein
MEQLERLPKDIATIIFNNPPEGDKSHQMICESLTEESLNTNDLFEIFLTIMMEGLFIKNPNINSDTLKMFNEKILCDLNPWLRSIGFSTIIEIVPYSEKKLFDNYYCKVILQCDPAWSAYFDAKELTVPYHFVLNSNCSMFHIIECKNLQNKTFNLRDLFAIFIFNNNVYKIFFNFI